MRRTGRVGTGDFLSEIENGKIFAVVGSNRPEHGSDAGRTAHSVLGTIRFIPSWSQGELKRRDRGSEPFWACHREAKDFTFCPADCEVYGSIVLGHPHLGIVVRKHCPSQWTPRIARYSNDE